MIEAKIDALIEALNKNTAALAALNSGPAAAATPEKKAPAEKKAEKKADTPPPAEKPAGPTLEQFREVAQKWVDANGPDEIKKLNAKYGLKKISDGAAAANAQEIFDALKALKADENPV